MVVYCPPQDLLLQVELVLWVSCDSGQFHCLQPFRKPLWHLHISYNRLLVAQLWHPPLLIMPFP